MEATEETAEEPPTPPLIERLWAVYRKAKAAGMVQALERPDLELVDSWDDRADLQ